MVYVLLILVENVVCAVQELDLPYAIPAAAQGAITYGVTTASGTITCAIAQLEKKKKKNNNILNIVESKEERGAVIAK